MEKLYEVSEVAEILHRTEKTVKRYINRDKTLEAYNIPGGYLIPESSIHKFLETYKV